MTPRFSWIAWILILLLGFTAPAQAMNAMAFTGVAKPCTAKNHSESYPLNFSDPSGRSPMGWASALGVTVFAYGAYKKSSQWYYGRNTDWYSKVDEVASNAATYGVDPEELKSVLDYYKQQFPNYVDIHCSWAQSAIYSSMKSHFSDLKTIRFKRGFLSHGDAYINPDNVVQIIPVDSSRGVVRPFQTERSILLYGGTQGFDPIKTARTHDVAQLDD